MRWAGRQVLRCAVALVVVALLACAGSVPSIPKSPEALLAKADSYYKREKWFQSGELYKAFLERYPGHDQSDLAQFRLAESLFNDGEYPLASVEYRLLISNYGYSDYVDDAVFKTGVCFFEQCPAWYRDLQACTDALGQFDQFIRTFPDSPLVPDARRYIKEIHTKQAHKALDTARWYYRIKKFDSSLIYCNKIIENYRDNSYWAEANYLKGMIRLKQGDDLSAARLFSTVASYPEDIEVKQQAQARLRELRGES